MFLSKKILFISHHKDAELGFMKNFFLKNNYEIKILRSLQGDYLPSDINNFSGIIILGGAMNTCDTIEYPGLKKELAWIKNILNLSIPVIGICLGAQLIAKVSGSKICDHRDNFVEIGYKEISFTNDSPYSQGFPKRVYHWHKQGFTLPNNAKLLASNSIFDVQAFSLKNNIIGLQFHPEVDKDMILNWNLKAGYMLTRKGAVSEQVQLSDHTKYSKFVRSWFEYLLKKWLNLN